MLLAIRDPRGIMQLNEIIAQPTGLSHRLPERPKVTVGDLKN